MTAALVKAVNFGMKQVLIPIDKELQSQQKQLEQQLTSHLETIRMRVADRLDVLWWSEAKYSPSLRLGYRKCRERLPQLPWRTTCQRLSPRWPRRA